MRVLGLADAHRTLFILNFLPGAEDLQGPWGPVGSLSASHPGFKTLQREAMPLHDKSASEGIQPTLGSSFMGLSPPLSKAPPATAVSPSAPTAAAV